MAKYKEAPCQYYICKGECEKGKDAEQKGLCQKCGKYVPRKGFKPKKNKRKDDKYKYLEG